MACKVTGASNLTLRHSDAFCFDISEEFDTSRRTFVGVAHTYARPFIRTVFRNIQDIVSSVDGSIFELSEQISNDGTDSASTFVS